MGNERNDSAPRVAVVGCRPPTKKQGGEADVIYGKILCDVETFIRVLSKASPEAVIVSGGALGVDDEAAHQADQFGLLVNEYVPNYQKHGRNAPRVRNTQIVDDADEIHAWPAPWSRGTWDTVRKAREAGKPCFVHDPAGCLESR